MEPSARSASAIGAEPSPEVPPPADDEAVNALRYIPIISQQLTHLQASSAAGSEVRRRRRRAGGGTKAAAPAAVENAESASELGAGVSEPPADMVQAQRSAAAEPSTAPQVPAAIESASGPTSRSGGGVRAAGRALVSSSRVSSLVEETDVVGEIVSTSQSGGRFLSGAVESGDSVLKRTVFKEMPLDGLLL
jgi:hypothetical protein